MDIAQSFPRLRSDLEARPTDVAGGRYIVDVTDPDSGKTFRFLDVEYFIATAMNGERDLAGLAAVAREELGIEPSAQELESVIETLAGLGYLDTASATPSIDDLTLGHAGGSMDALDAGMPVAPDLELGLAGASNMDMPEEEATYVAPDLSLGRAGGNQRMASGFPGVDEDDVPTSIKDSRLSGSMGQRPSDPSIPPRPPTDNLEPTPSLTPVTASTDDDDTHLPPPATDFDDEMSVDLTDHMKLGPEALKEAVRQSQMIQAVNPDELLRKTPPPPPMPSILDDEPDALDTPPATPEPAQARDPGTGRAEQPGPVVLPSERVQVSSPVDVPGDVDDRPIGLPTPEPSPSRAGLLLLLFLLVLVGAAAAVYFLDLFNVRARLGLQSASQEVAASGKTTAPKTTPATEKPVKIALPSATLVAKDTPPVEVQAAQAGVLASVVASGTQLVQGDEIARFKGGEAQERAIASTTARLSYYEDKLRKAQETGKQSEIDKAQKKVDEKKADIEAARTKLEAFIVRAPMAGPIETSLAANARVEAGQVLASFKTPPVLVATFTVPADKKLAQGEEVEVVSKADEAKRAGCQVAAMEGSTVTVECPSNESLAASDEVLLP